MSFSNPSLFLCSDYETTSNMQFQRAETEETFAREFQDLFYTNHLTMTFILLLSKCLGFLWLLKVSEISVTTSITALFALSLFVNFVAFFYIADAKFFIHLITLSTSFESYLGMKLLPESQYYLTEVFCWVSVITMVRTRFKDIWVILFIKFLIHKLIFIIDSNLSLNWDSSNTRLYVISAALVLIPLTYKTDYNNHRQWMLLDSMRKTKIQFESFFDKFSFISGVMDARYNFIRLNSKAKATLEGRNLKETMTTQAFENLTNELHNFAWELDIPYNSNHILNLKEIGAKICDVYVQKVSRKDIPNCSFQYVFVIIRHDQFHMFMSFFTSIKGKAIRLFRSFLENAEEVIINKDENKIAYFNPLFCQLNSIANFYLTQNQIFETYSSSASVGDLEQEDAFYIVNYTKKMLDSVSYHAFARFCSFELNVEVADDTVVLGKLWIIDRYVSNAIWYLFEKDLVTGLSAKLSLEDSKCRLKLEFAKKGKAVNLDSFINGDESFTNDPAIDSKLLPCQIHLIHLGKIMREAFISFQVTELDKKVTINIKCKPITVANPSLPLFQTVNLLALSDKSENCYKWNHEQNYIIKKMASEDALERKEKRVKKKKKSSVVVFKTREKLKLADSSMNFSPAILKDLPSASRIELPNSNSMERLSHRKFTPTFIRISSSSSVRVNSVVNNIGEMNLTLLTNSNIKRIVLNSDSINLEVASPERKEKGEEDEVNEGIEEMMKGWENYMQKLMESTMLAITSQSLSEEKEVEVKIPEEISNLWMFNPTSPETGLSLTSIFFDNPKSMRPFERSKSQTVTLLSPTIKKPNSLEEVKREIGSPKKVSLPILKKELLDAVEEKTIDNSGEELLKIDEVPKKSEVSGNDIPDSQSSCKNLSSSNESMQKALNIRRSKSKFSTLETFISPSYNEKPTFLIVDDNPMVRMTISKTKMDIECKFVSAKSCDAGFKKWEEYALDGKCYHGIFVDVVMPEKGGEDFAQLIREFEKSHKLFRTWICGMKIDEDEVITEGLDGVDHVVKKPIPKDILNDIVRKRLNEIGECPS